MKLNFLHYCFLLTLIIGTTTSVAKAQAKVGPSGTVDLYPDFNRWGVYTNSAYNFYAVAGQSITDARFTYEVEVGDEFSIPHGIYYELEGTDEANSGCVTQLSFATPVKTIEFVNLKPGTYDLVMQLAKGGCNNLAQNKQYRVPVVIGEYKPIDFTPSFANNGSDYNYVFSDIRGGTEAVDLETGSLEFECALVCGNQSSATTWPTNAIYTKTLPSISRKISFNSDSKCPAGSDITFFIREKGYSAPGTFTAKTIKTPEDKPEEKVTFTLTCSNILIGTDNPNFGDDQSALATMAFEIKDFKGGYKPNGYYNVDYAFSGNSLGVQNMMLNSAKTIDVVWDKASKSAFSVKVCTAEDLYNTSVNYTEGYTINDLKFPEPIFTLEAVGTTIKVKPSCSNIVNISLNVEILYPGETTWKDLKRFYYTKFNTVNTQVEYTDLPDGEYKVRIMYGRYFAAASAATFVEQTIRVGEPEPEPEPGIPLELVESVVDQSAKSICIKVKGGIPPYACTLIKKDGDYTGAFVDSCWKDLPPGTYVVNVTDAGAESVSSSEIVIEQVSSEVTPPIINVWTDPSNIPCSGGTTVIKFDMSAENTGGYLYRVALKTNGVQSNWAYLTPGTTSALYSDRGVGSYSVLVGYYEVLNGENNNVYETLIRETEEFEIKTPSPIKVTSEIIVGESPVAEQGFGTGSATAIATGGTPPLRYTLSLGTEVVVGFPNNQFTWEGLIPGDYNIKVEDFNDCPFATADFTITPIETVAPVIVFDLEATDIVCDATLLKAGTIIVSNIESDPSKELQAKLKKDGEEWSPAILITSDPAVISNIINVPGKYFVKMFYKNEEETSAVEERVVVLGPTGTTTLGVTMINGSSPVPTDGQVNGVDGEGVVEAVVTI